jgi:hypothetical protein
VAAVVSRLWVIEIPGRPQTLNRERTGTTHWHVTRDETRVTREVAWALAKQQQIPHMEAITVCARPILRDGRTQDVGACIPSVKAAIDGLVDAGVLDDDGPTQVVQLTFDAPFLRMGRDALELTIEEVL